ncbi:leucine-rich repeat domain-containing protein [Capnocytophaga sp. oral taxon 324]|jgi:hypothetical protein|uniref:leucine-rich repeat domain-containing protein n=1 Tax=Capnocytophaga sp. oral taxon 324 TaxID=712211 RepID=UPI0002A37710|nr:leucine-rich repeat domain-containing protein [Capnocytophaga sp. oral taxon 324]EKY12052.1 hypothetical protein HMPREF9072_02185 [Capnocytophaga sp. oral taxon 324 str. F0483]
MKNILLLATVVLAFASCSKSDDDNNLPSSDYKLSADGLTLVQWTNSTTTTLDMQADNKLQKVNTIGENAFKGHKKLQTITFPDNLKEIGANAFEGASLSGTVTFNTNATVTFGKEAFKSSGIRVVKLPKTAELSNSIFEQCSNLTEVTFSSVKKIGENAFYQTALTEVNLDNTGLTELAGAGFSLCSNLTKITLPTTLQSIGKLSFFGCSKLQTMIINAEKVPTLVDKSAFHSSTPNIYVPSNLVDNYKAANVWNEYKDHIFPKQ